MIDFTDETRTRSAKHRHTSNLWVEYHDDARNMYNCAFRFNLGETCIGIINGATADAVISAFLYNASRRTLKLVKEFVDEELKND